MATKSNKRGLRVSTNVERYVMQDGTRLKVPVLPGNVPRMMGTRTGNDKNYLEDNNGKLLKAQQILAQ